MNKIAKRLRRITLVVVSLIVMMSSFIHSTYAWMKFDSKEGTHPYYEIEFTTPNSEYYAVLEVASGEVYNEETGEYEIQYIPITESAVNLTQMYPGDSVNLRFAIINMGTSSSSLSIYFKNVIDTKLKDYDTKEPLNKFLSQSVLMGSSTFSGSNNTSEFDDGFVFYASEKMDYQPSNLERVYLENSICSETAECYLNNSAFLFASNLEVPGVRFQEGKDEAYYNAKLEEIRQSGVDIERKSQELIFDTYEVTYFDWYILLDRKAGLETVCSLFQIGTVVFTLD